MRAAVAALGVRICLLAGLIQVLAPAWAFASAARLFADPLGDIAICAGHTEHPEQAPTQNTHPCIMCPACHHGGSGPFMLPVSIADVPAPTGYVVARYSHRLATPPRGPPTPSQRARAPPTDLRARDCCCEAAMTWQKGM